VETDDVITLRRTAEQITLLEQEMTGCAPTVETYRDYD
jgi:hypothetical protein